jgi:hypothetical protein
MASRFTYARLTPAQIKTALQELGLNARSLAKLGGWESRTVLKWLSGDSDPPHNLALALTLLTIPGALEKARALASHMIQFDNGNMHLGEWPFRGKDNTDDKAD